MGTFRNLMIIFGMLFCVLVLTFAIGMCFPGFRQGLNNTLHVVPENTYNVTVEELTQKSTLLETLQADKASLEDELETLQQSFDADETEIATLETEIADLNEDIVALQDNLVRISNNINGATLTYKGEQVCVSTPVYDADNGRVYYSGFDNRGGSSAQYNGVDFLDMWNNHLKTIFLAYQDSLINSPYDLEMDVNDMYYLNIDDDIIQFCFSNHTYRFAGNVTSSLQFMVNDVAVDINDIANSIVPNKHYTTKTYIDYSINSMNKVSDIDITLALQEI